MSDAVAADRPSFAQAFAAEPVTAADPAPATPTPSDPTAAASASAETTPPSATESTPGTTSDVTPPGPIPLDRHQSILENTRVKAKAEAQAEFDRDYGHLKGLSPETAQEWKGIANRMATDPIGFLSELQRQIEAHPTFGPQLKSHAARTLASGRQQQQDLSPDLIVDDGQGHQIQTFSADRVQAIVQHSIQQALAKEIQPIKQDFETRKQAEKAQAEQRQLDQRSETIHQRALSKLTLFKENEQEIGLALQKMPDDVDPGEALYMAWAEVVLPKLDATSKAEHLKSLATKAAATTLKPGAATSPSTRPKSFNDASLKWG